MANRRRRPKGRKTGRLPDLSLSPPEEPAAAALDPEAIVRELARLRADRGPWRPPSPHRGGERQP
jgi:hypothetical protein